MEHATMWDLQPYELTIANHMQHSQFYGRSIPKHAVSDAFQVLADSKKPEATILIELSQYALQHHTHIGMSC